MTESEFVRAIAPMVATVNKPMSADQIRAWHLMLGDLDPGVIQRAVVVTMREYTYAGFPPVGLVRKNAGCTSEKLQVHDRIAIAWAAIKSAIANVGGYRSVMFDDPLVTATIRALGGWERFCNCEPGERFDVWLRKDFEGAYRACLANGINAEQAKPLAGLIEISRSKCGYAQDAGSVETVVTGLPSLPHLVRGQIDKLRPLTIEEPNREFVDGLLCVPEEGFPQERGSRDVDKTESKTESKTETKAEAIERLQAWSKAKGAQCLPQN